MDSTTLAAAAVVAVGAGAVAVLAPTTRVECYEGKIAIELDVLFRSASARRVDPGALVTRDAGGSKGVGVFAAVAVPRGTCLGSYTGERLDGAEFAARYGGEQEPSYVLRVDSDCYIDGAAAAAEAKLSGETSMSLLNHASAAEATVVRYCESRRPPAVFFFAKRDVAAGEELVFDYGAAYWRGRRDAAPDESASSASAALRPRPPSPPPRDAAATDWRDRTWLDPGDPRDQGPLLEKLKSLYKADPKNFEAAYIATTFALLVALSQAIVRWYKYNVWLPPPPPLDF